MILRRSGAPGSSPFGSPELGILHYNKGAKSTASTMGPGAGRYRLQDILPSRRPKWETRRAVQAFGVPPRKGGGRKPANHDDLGKKPFRETALSIVPGILGTPSVTTHKKMESRIRKEDPRGGAKRSGISTSMEIGSNPGEPRVESPKGQERRNAGNTGRPPV